jgi:hypothetical protein
VQKARFEQALAVGAPEIGGADRDDALILQGLEGLQGVREFFRWRRRDTCSL